MGPSRIKKGQELLLPSIQEEDYHNSLHTYSRQCLRLQGLCQSLFNLGLMNREAQSSGPLSQAFVTGFRQNLFNVILVCCESQPSRFLLKAFVTGFRQNLFNVSLVCCKAQPIRLVLQAFETCFCQSLLDLSFVCCTAQPSRLSSQSFAEAFSIQAMPVCFRAQPFLFYFHIIVERKNVLGLVLVIFLND